MTELPEGPYLRDDQTGQYTRTQLHCKPSEAVVPEGQTLFMREGGEWLEVERKKTHPLIAEIRAEIDGLHTAVAILENKIDEVEDLL